MAVLRDMLATYFHPSNDESLEETMERVKADCPRAEVDAILADIADVLRLHDNDIQAAYDSGLLRSYYWPGGDGLTVRQWLELLQKFLMAPPDISRDHRSGAFG
jgi:CdiI immunity protein